MRIGLYGGMANNMYVLARALANAGADVRFVRDRGDQFPVSQPVWEDAEVTLAPAAAGPERWSPAAWTELERAHGWAPPPWLHDPSEVSRRPSARALAVRVALRAGLGGGGRGYLDAATAALAPCDVLVVCGVEPLLLAAALGRPFVLWPHGGDLRLAAGLAASTPGRCAALRAPLLRLSLARALRRAAWVGTHDPTVAGGHVGDVRDGLPWLRPRHLPLPLPGAPRPAPAARRAAFEGLLTRLGAARPAGEVMLFVPSRLDFVWKGQDMLLRAIARPGLERIGLVLAGWGRDLPAVRTMIDDLGLARRVSLLPALVSKPLLLRLFAGADLVVDQFHFGAYGTAAVEAMAQGAPVLMWLDEGAFRARGWRAPPVLLARDEAGIARTLADVASGGIDLEAQGALCARWAAEVHGPDAVVPGLIRDLAVAVGD